MNETPKMKVITKEGSEYLFSTIGRGRDRQEMWKEIIKEDGEELIVSKKKKVSKKMQEWSEAVMFIYRRCGIGGARARE